MAETPFFLSHHRPHEYDRCFSLGGIHLCARCLGVYPVMFAVIALQLALRTPKALALDWLALLLPLPALVDWARGRFNPRSGTNPMRLATGILLGAALGRTLYQHMRQPGHPLAMAQLGGLLVAAAMIEVISRPWRLRRLSDPNGAPAVHKDDRDDRTS